MKTTSTRPLWPGLYWQVAGLFALLLLIWPTVPT